ncbi:MAG: F0F1 ATP synthase subunit B, partial [Sulfuricella sp.]
YRPILNAIDAREKRIALALADADAKKAEAQQERDAFQHKNEEFDRQRAALLSQAADAAKAERLRLLDAARQESDSLRAKRQEALRSEQQSLSEALTRRAREEVFAIARKALADLAGATLEERMADVFLRRLRELDDAAMVGLKSAFRASSSPLLVRTAFTLPPPHRATIETALKETLGRETQVQFETAPDLVSGIEISTDGHKVAWSIADYLTSLGKGVDELLKAQPKAEAKTGQNANEHRA